MNIDGEIIEKNIVQKIRIRNVEKRGKCWNVEHSTIGNEITITFIIIFKV
jgi:hypothetical protein